MLVVFPLGLFFGGWILDLIGKATSDEQLWAASFYCTIAGLVGGFCAAIPGLIDWFTVIPPRSRGKRRGLMHAILNTLVVIAFLIIAIHRSSSTAAPGRFELVLMTLAIMAMGVSGWLGGTLSYRNQIGVDHRSANAGSWRERAIESWERPACNQSELGEGQMMLVHVGNERRVIGRCADGIVAFSDHCTHKGGSLADGALIGCTVQCPWHGSQFDIHTGRVIAGPAKNKVDIYDIEIRAGEVYIRHRAKQEPKAA